MARDGGSLFLAGFVAAGERFQTRLALLIQTGQKMDSTLGLVQKV
jgi:hypothetical protein